MSTPIAQIAAGNFVMESLPPRLRPLGWAGLLAPVSSAWRPARVEGDHLKGLLLLADRERPRLELAWATVYRRRFDAQAILQRRLAAALDKQDRAEVPARVRTLPNPAFAPLMHLDDQRRGVDRLAGYCPLTRRVVQAAYHRGEAREDADFLQHTALGLLDQPLDQPLRWAFFGLSFQTPAGMAYQAATLNLGDMLVRVGRAGASEFSGPGVVLRQVYPATLALARQPLTQWMQAMMQPLEKVYRGPRASRRVRDPRFQSISTARGPGLFVPLGLRLLLRPFLWRSPRRRGLWLIHDESANRLLCVHLAGDPATFQATLEGLLDGLHWAGVGGDS